MDKLYTEHYSEGRLTQEDISLATGLSIMEVRQALYKAGCKLSQTHTEEWALEVSMMPPDGNIELQARQYLVDLAFYRRLKYQVKTTKKTEDRTVLKTAMIVENKTQLELATEFGVSQATVSRHNPKRRKNKPYSSRMNPTTWRKIKSYLANNGNNISEAARHFKVSRQTIYRNLRHDN